MSRRVAAVLLAAVAATGLAACDSGGGTTAPRASSATSASVAPDPAGAVPTGISVPIAGWDLAFAPTARDAAAAIKAVDPSGKPPAAGQQFVMVTITAKNSGPDKANPAGKASSR